MRIAHVLAGDGWGGAERLACAIAEGSRARQLEVVVEPSPYTPAAVRETCLARSNEVVRTLKPGSATRPNVLLGWARTARRRIRAFAPDVVHVHLSSPSFGATGLAVAAGFPSVWTFHLLPPGSWPLDRALRLPSSWVLRLALSARNATFVGVSRADTAALRERFPAGSAVLVANAPPPAATEETRLDRRAWKGASVALLFVGRLEPQKGCDRLIRALAAPALAPIDFRLLVVGNGSERTALAALTARLGLADRVEFLGERPSRSAMQAADFVLCPGRHEGMPLVPMEAVREGAGVVASPIAAHRDLFVATPDAILPEDEAAWPAWLSRLFSDPARMAALRAAQAGTKARHSLERVIAEYIALYERAAARRR